jgi:hypothetical protein
LTGLVDCPIDFVFEFGADMRASVLQPVCDATSADDVGEAVGAGLRTIIDSGR